MARPFAFMIFISAYPKRKSNLLVPTFSSPVLFLWAWIACFCRYFRLLCFFVRVGSVGSGSLGLTVVGLFLDYVAIVGQYVIQASQFFEECLFEIGDGEEDVWDRDADFRWRHLPKEFSVLQDSVSDLCYLAFLDQSVESAVMMNAVAPLCVQSDAALDSFDFPFRLKRNAFDDLVKLGVHLTQSQSNRSLLLIFLAPRLPG